MTESNDDVLASQGVQVPEPPMNNKTGGKMSNIFSDESMQAWEALTREQVALLHEVYFECRKLGATPKQLAPLGALVWIPMPQPPPTQGMIEYGQELARRLEEAT